MNCLKTFIISFDRAIAYNSNLDVSQALIQAGADVNARSTSGITVLMYAVDCSNNPDIIKALIQAGAQVNAQTVLNNRLESVPRLRLSRLDP